MSGKRTLSDMIAEKGYPQDVADDVREEVETAGTEAAILAGTLVLPHPTDAQRHLHRKQGVIVTTPTEQDFHRRLQETEARIRALESEKTTGGNK